MMFKVYNLEKVKKTAGFKIFKFKFKFQMFKVYNCTSEWTNR